MQITQRGFASMGECFVSLPRVGFACPQRDLSVVEKGIRFKAKAGSSEPLKQVQICLSRFEHMQIEFVLFKRLSTLFHTPKCEIVSCNSVFSATVFLESRPKNEQVHACYCSLKTERNCAREQRFLLTSRIKYHQAPNSSKILLANRYCSLN